MSQMIRNLGLALAVVLSAAVAQADKTLVYCSEGSPSTFNPQIASDGPSFNASSQPIYNRLVEFQNGGTKVIPGLAESWTNSKDNTEITFNLRKKVSFHQNELFTPTRDFNADDVVFTFNRMRLKDHPYHNVSGGKYEYFDSMDMGKLIKDIVKVDDYTVKFVLTQPEAPFMANLAMDFASILSAEYGDVLAKKSQKDKMDSEPIGTGPFIFKRYVKDSSIRFDANPKYFRGRPKLDKLLFSITPDASVRYQKLKAGECQFIAEPAPADLISMGKEPSLKIMDQAGLNVGYIAMNVNKKPFDNPLVRRAINHALNRKAYIESIYLGHAEVAKNPIPPTLWSYNKGTQDYDYNIEKAKALLKQAGLEKGFSTELWTLPVSRPYNPNGKKMGELIQSDLAKVGIQVKLVTYDWPTYLAKSKLGEHQMIQMGWTGDNGDPDNFLNVLLGCNSIESGSNMARWCDKSFQTLIDKARTSMDIKKRTAFYEDAQTVFKKQAPWVTVAHAKAYRAMSKKVQGYKQTPLGTDRFDEADLK